MVYLKRFWEWLKTPYYKYQQEKKFKEKMEELKKRDPFIYK